MMLASCCCVFVCLFVCLFFFLHNIIFKFDSSPINDKNPSPNIAFSPCSGRQNLVLSARKDRKYIEACHPTSGIATYPDPEPEMSKFALFFGSVL